MENQLNNLIKNGNEKVDSTVYVHKKINLQNMNLFEKDWEVKSHRCQESKFNIYINMQIIINEDGTIQNRKS
jgi:hypothetical protein